MGKHGKHGDLVISYADIWNTVFVECPSCSGKAILENWAITCTVCAYRGKRQLPDWNAPALPVRCGSCGVQIRPERRAFLARCSACGEMTPQRNMRPVEMPPLWAETMTRHGVLWATNPLHLAAMRGYLAGARHHPFDPVRKTHRLPNADWRSRLPGWAKQARNRTHVMKAMDRLEARFAGSR